MTSQSNPIPAGQTPIPVPNPSPNPSPNPQPAPVAMPTAAPAPKPVQSPVSSSSSSAPTAVAASKPTASSVPAANTPVATPASASRPVIATSTPSPSKPTAESKVSTNLSSAAATVSAVSRNIFSSVLSLLAKPSTTLKTELKRFDKIKDSVIFAGIVVGIAAILQTVVAAFASLSAQKGPSFSVGRGSISIGGLGPRFEFAPYLMRSLVFYLLIVGGIALVYYLISNFMKLSASFSRLLGLAATAIVPYTAISIIFPRLFAYLYDPVGSVFVSLGLVYALLFIITGSDHELDLKEGNRRFHIHLIAIAIIAVIYSLSRTLVI